MEKVLFVYNSVTIEEKVQNMVLGECASGVTVGMVFEALVKTGSQVIPLNLRNPEQLEQVIEDHSVDMAFVIAEGFLDLPHTFYDGSGAMMVREILTGKDIPFTHSSPETMKILRNKACTHMTLSEAGIRVPSFAVIDAEEDLEAQVKNLEKNMPYPLFVKPAGGGSSVCIDKYSVVHNRQELMERIRMVQMVLSNQPVLVETFLPGREYTVCVLGNHEKFVLPVIGFAWDAGVRSAADKGIFHRVDPEIELLPINHPVALNLSTLCTTAFEVLGVQDIVRVDIKECADGVCHVIDMNGTPSLGSNGSVVAMAAAAGIHYDEVVALILYEAMVRENCPIPSQLMEMVTEPLVKLRALQSSKVA